jgi:L-ascorbate metabolism protein UlaG (beta-lactamase superfamily)
MFAVGLTPMFLPSSIALVPAISDTVPATTESAQVWYLGANGWAVLVNDRFLIFDYQYWTDQNPPGADETRTLERAYIDPVQPSSFDVYVFVTHSHQDHFDPVIFEWEEKLERITYIFGWKAGDYPEHHYMASKRANERIDGMEVYTIYSHHSGVPEVAFLVLVDGYVIYHNGDYKAEYLQDYEYLRTITEHIDIAFVIGHPDQSHQYFKQAEHLEEIFHPAYMFPMNREGESYRCGEFSELLADHGVNGTIVVFERRGTNYQCAWKSQPRIGPGSEQRPLN